MYTVKFTSAYKKSCNCSVVDSFRPASRATSLKEGGFWGPVQAPSPRELSAAG